MRGRVLPRNAELRLPIYLSADVQGYFVGRAAQKERRTARQDGEQATETGNQDYRIGQVTSGPTRQFSRQKVIWRVGPWAPDPRID